MEEALVHIFANLGSILEDVGDYRRLVERMCKHPNCAIFRCLGELNALNLLYPQAELADLETDLCAHAAAAAKSPIPMQWNRSFHWPTSSRVPGPDGSPPARWLNMLKTRKVLRQYSKLHLSRKLVGPVADLSCNAVIERVPVKQMTHLSNKV
jgi:hypothetical protein